MTRKFAWKVLEKGMKSNKGNLTWKKGKWIENKEKLEICKSGLHASKLLFDAIQYVTPGIICLVEYSGEVIKSDDKFVCSKMRIIKTYKFTKEKAIEFAIFSARLCLHNFEKKYPNDDRPRKAIEVAEKYLKNPTKKNKENDMSAKSAVMSAISAESDAMSAVISAKYAVMSAVMSAMYAVISAKYAARSAVMSTKYAARSAVMSAMSAVMSAEYSDKNKINNKINNKLLKIIGYKIGDRK